jgi:hypothetical protein
MSHSLGGSRGRIFALAVIKNLSQDPRNGKSLVNADNEDELTEEQIQA